jgi:hypothetical protein
VDNFLDLPSEQRSDGDFNWNACNHFSGLPDAWFNDLATKDWLLAELNLTHRLERNLNGCGAIRRRQCTVLRRDSEHVANFTRTFGRRLKNEAEQSKQSKILTPVTGIRLQSENAIKH